MNAPFLVPTSTLTLLMHLLLPVFSMKLSEVLLCGLLLFMHRRNRVFTSQWNQGPEPGFAQEKSSPRQNAEANGEQEPRILQPHHGCGCAAEIPSQQNGAKYGRARNHIENGANQQRDADGLNQTCGVPGADRAIDHGLQLQDFQGAIEEQEQNCENGDDTSRDEFSF